MLGGFAEGIILRTTGNSPASCIVLIDLTRRREMNFHCAIFAVTGIVSLAVGLFTANNDAQVAASVIVYSIFVCGAMLSHQIYQQLDGK